MSKSTFTLCSDIGVAPKGVRELLADLHAFSALHPLVESVESIRAREGREKANSYGVVDLVSLDPLRIRATHTAALEVRPDSEAVGDAWERPGVRLHTMYSLASSTRGTRLTERVEVNAPFGLGRFVTTQARRAHEKMLDRVREHIEG